MPTLPTRLLKAVVVASAVLAGCSPNPIRDGYSQLDYGVPSPPSDPTVELVDFSYEPPSPVRAGDTMLFTVVTNKPTYTGMVNIKVAHHWNVLPRDDGKPPDETARDCVWRALLALPDPAPPYQDADVFVTLSPYVDQPGHRIDGPPLTILPAEEAQ